jgi:preprotein translocase subunit SecG
MFKELKMYSILMMVSVFIAIVLIITVLLQSSKGGGLAGSFGGTGTFGTVFGTRRTADFLSKTTWWLGGSLIVMALVINLFFLKPAANSQKSAIQDATQQVPPTSSLPVQNQNQAPVKK